MQRRSHQHLRSPRPGEQLPLPSLPDRWRQRHRRRRRRRHLRQRLGARPRDLEQPRLRNAGAYNGGIRVGVPYLQIDTLPTGARQGGRIAGLGYDINVKIHHNQVSKNGTVETTAGQGGAGGGISICAGTDNYSVDHNFICGNISSSDGGGIGHVGFSQNGRITFNQLLFNQSFQQTSSTHGGGIIVIGEPPVAGTLSLGTGDVTIDANVIRGNFAEGGQGGGIRLQQVNGADVIGSRRRSAGTGSPSPTTWS